MGMIRAGRSRIGTIRDTVNSPSVTAMPTEASKSADDRARPVAEAPVGAGCSGGGQRPVRLASWAGDVDVAGGPSGPGRSVVAGHDDALPATDGEVWDPQPWIDHMRVEHPDRTLAVLYDEPGGSRNRTGAPGGPPHWLRRLDDVVECISGGSHRFEIDGVAGSLAALRHDVGVALVGTSPGSVDETVVSDAVLMVDELVSNAVEHADGGLSVHLSIAGDALIIAVSDPHPERLPVLGRPPSVQPSGRGLLVVDALSTRWGTVVDRTSKSVWAEAVWPS